MRSLTIITAMTAALAFSPGPGEAQGCPPGLAKKSPACVPPGQAKKGGWGRGDVLTGNYVLVRDRDRYRLPPLRQGEQYYRMGDRILRVDDGTREILDVIALGAELLNQGG